MQNSTLEYVDIIVDLYFCSFILQRIISVKQRTVPAKQINQRSCSVMSQSSLGRYHHSYAQA